MFKDLKNKRFGRLLVIKFSHKGKYRHSYWLCKCDCGTKKIIKGMYLLLGHTKSCGCLQKELVLKRMTKHGMHGTKFYYTFVGLKNRCNNKNDKEYHNYGKRGIKCQWKSFEEFHHDMYESYMNHIKKFGKKQTTIDRINNDINYCKENCRWATTKEQGNNRRNNIIFIFNGKKKNLTEWCLELKLNYGTIKSRFYRDGRNSNELIKYIK